MPGPASLVMRIIPRSMARPKPSGPAAFGVALVPKDGSFGRFASVVDGDFTNVCLLWVPPEMRPVDLDAIGPSDVARLHHLAPRVKSRMQDEGTALVGYQPIRDLNCFRLLFMNPDVTTTDVDALLDLIDRYATAEWAS